ncbi:NUDIX domain-containing protein [Bosea sp. BIWAKO-01]|uniref:NUDIX hydrolase n=1 Tax=Bosea sp. BIWAKO-01 TaxID=506668 RepID=UPI000852FDCE|nr:NUDIX domain-containing protein [Bosea sp. BIWAKO-01]GAU81480.1 MutT-family protein [Bosea sp. BIWAKO-01]
MSLRAETASKPERFKLVVAVYVIFRRGSELLLLRRANTGYEDGNYGLVSGHHDGSEPLRAAAAREAREEAGVEIDPASLTFATVLHRSQDEERLDFFFEARSWQGELLNAEPEKCAELAWFPIDDLPENTIAYVRTAIVHWQSGTRYCEFWRET